MVTSIKSNYVVDDKGKAVSVLLDIKAYGKILAELEELEAIRAFDAAKASGEKPLDLERALAGKESHAGELQTTDSTACY